MKKISSILISIFLITLVFNFTSCKKSDYTGQGGYESLRAPVSYEDIDFNKIDKSTADKNHSDGELLSEIDGDALALETEEEPLPPLEYFVYRVKEHDYIGEIAKKFNVSEDTIISVNNVKNSRRIQIGDYFKIPTMSGIMYTVRRDGETVESISSKYEIPSDKCGEVNALEQKVALKAGTTLFLPDAELDWVTRQEINGDLFKRPLRGRYYFSSYYGWRNSPFSGKRTFHGGIDMACPAGTPIYAALEGTVSRAGYDNVFGNFVEVRHHSGYKTLYAHMSKITTYKGAVVTTNTKLGEVGTTGMSTGNHLHFGVYKNGKSLNPQLLWN